MCLGLTLGPFHIFGWEQTSKPTQDRGPERALMNEEELWQIGLAIFSLGSMILVSMTAKKCGKWKAEEVC
jgi:hypothetical protein